MSYKNYFFTKQTHSVCDWKVIEGRYTTASVTQYIEIWEDYDALKSYEAYNKSNYFKKDGLNEKGNKTASLRCKYNRIKSAVEGIKKVGEWEAIERKPDSLEDYEAWKLKLKQNSYMAAEKTFKQFACLKVLPEKIKRVEQLNITALLKCVKEYEKKLKVGN